jgi:hypothetical protein
MPTHAEKRILRHSPDQLFDLVSGEHGGVHVGVLVWS